MEVAEPPASMGRASPEAPGWQWPVPSLRGRREGSGGRDLSTPLRTDAVHEKVHSVLIQLFCTLLSAHPGAPVLFQGLQPEEELQLWNEIDDACSTLLSLDSQPQASNALEELCITIMGTLPKPQETDEKDNTKRFLFHYSKTRKLGNSNVVEEFQGPIQIRRQFLFRPRNGRSSEGYI
ncbi:neuromedin-U isoform X4 [Halichoerus grypus]